ncbi:MAG: CRISPR-associated endonuclease Cas2 [Candidatus Eisenbacteria bacterium]
MLYVVVYDIEDDRVRDRLARLLLRFGERVQESVFECRITPKKAALMIERLGYTLGSAEAGNVRVYRVCPDCHAASVGLGRLKKTEGDEPWVII